MMNLAFFKLSAFDKIILEKCPTMQYGASFIKYIGWCQIIIAFFAGWLALSLFSLSNPVLNMLLAFIFSFTDLMIIKWFDERLHKYRKWITIISITFFILIIAFLQTGIIGSFLFKTEFVISSILDNKHIPEYWLDKLLYYLKKPLYIFSFKNKVVSVMSIALFIVIFFIKILPFAITFFYRKSKYYHTQELIENFKTEYERISKN